MGPLRFGIIACSSVARRRFLPALATSRLATLQRVGSRDPKKAADFAKQFGAAQHGDYESVVSDPEVDIVYISTPPSVHAEWVRKAAAAGKHIWCEKPAFSDYRTAVEMVEFCRKSKVRLIEGYVFKYHPQHACLRSLIGAGRIGQPRVISCEFTYPRPAEGDIRLRRDLEGGIFHDSAGYPVAAALLQASGKPTSLFCQLRLDEATGVDDTFGLWLSFSSGEVAQLVVGFGLFYRAKFAVSGSKGRAELQRAFAVPPQTKATIILETEGSDELIPIDFVDQFQLMIDDVANEIRANGSKPFEADLLRQHAIMDAAGRSAKEGRLVNLSEYNL
jgi:predicted dehydrogenase